MHYDEYFGILLVIQLLIQSELCLEILFVILQYSNPVLHPLAYIPDWKFSTTKSRFISVHTFFN